MQLQAKSNPAPKHVHHLWSIPLHSSRGLGTLPLRPALTLITSRNHPPLFMDDSRIYHTVLDRLSDDVLGVLFRVEVELEADVAQRDARVGKGEFSDPRFDYVLPEARDERQRCV